MARGTPSRSPECLVPLLPIDPQTGELHPLHLADGNACEPAGEEHRCLEVTRYALGDDVVEGRWSSAKSSYSLS